MLAEEGGGSELKLGTKESMIFSILDGVLSKSLKQLGPVNDPISLYFSYRSLSEGAGDDEDEPTLMDVMNPSRC